MAVNKVMYGQNTIIDISDTTATASDVASGKYFYGNDGVKTLGTSSGGGGGGGSSSWELIASTEMTISTTTTSGRSAGTVSCGSEVWTKSKIIYVRVRDKAGKRAGYFYGSDTFFINLNAANNSTTTFTAAGRFTYKYDTSNKWGGPVSGSTTGYGVYGNSITSSGTVLIYSRYNSSSSLTVDGTYKIEVYALDYPDGVSPFDA